MKVLVCGDWHGNVWAAEQAFFQAEDYGCSSLIHVGDMGYWEHVQPGVHFLNALQIFAEDARVDMFFADGNHENHPMLRERYTMTDQGIRYCRPLIKHVERGYMVGFGGRLVQFFGGAWSINNPHDKIWERYPERFGNSVTWEGKNWWPEEEPTHYDVATAKVQIIKHGKPDVLITHDAPWSLGDSVLPVSDELAEDFPQSQPSREMIEDVWTAGEPSLTIHGHYHHFYERTMPWGNRFLGLAKESRRNANAVLDLATLSYRML